MTADIEYPPNCQPVLHSQNNSDLIKRLKILSEALQNSDTNDDAGDSQRFRSLLEHLTDARFLEKTNADVQIWLASCIVDIFRIFSPNCPIGDPSHLKDVLLFVIRSLKGLEALDSPLFRRYFYVLENLSACSSLNLCCELPPDDASSVIRKLMLTALEIPGSKGWKGVDRRQRSDDSSAESSGDDEADDRIGSHEKVAGLLLSVISGVLQEADRISNEVLDAILFFLINPQKLNNREGYNMARNIMQLSVTALESPLDQLLCHGLMSGGLPDECRSVGNTLSKLHEVIIELYEIIPEHVQTTIPRFLPALKDENESSRLLNTKLIGNLIIAPRSRFFDDFPDVWNAYISRFKDKSVAIRIECAQMAAKILVKQSQARGQVSDALHLLLLDADDTVREAAISSVTNAALEKLEAVNEKLINTCCERFRDRKAPIRLAAIQQMLNLYSRVAKGEEYTASDRQSVAVIPQKLFSFYALMLPGMENEKMYIERYWYNCIIPFTMPVRKRIAWMIEVFCGLDKRAGQAFCEILARFSHSRRLLREIIDVIGREDKPEDKPKDLQSRIQRLAQGHPDAAAFMGSMRLFANLLSKDQRAIECAEYLVGNEYSCEEAVVSLKSLVQKVHDHAKENTSVKDYASHVRRLLERIAPLLMDADAAEELVNNVIRVCKDNECGKIKASIKLPLALKLLKTWCEYFPHMFAAPGPASALQVLLTSDDRHAAYTAAYCFFYVSSQRSMNIRGMPWSEGVSDTCWTLMRCETPGFDRTCKVAFRVCTLLLGKEEMKSKLDTVLEELMKRVSMENDSCLNALRTLCAIVQQYGTAPDFFELFHQWSSESVVGLILSDDTAIDDPRTFDANASLNTLPMPKFTAIKLYAMKFMARFAFATADNTEFMMDSLVMKMINLYATLVDNHGDVHDEDLRISPVEKVWMRAMAGNCLIKLCHSRKYNSMMPTVSFLSMAELVKDEYHGVREYFARRLQKGLQRMRLHVEFLSIFSLVALVRPISAEQEELVTQHKQLCRQAVERLANAMRTLAASNNISPALVPYYQPELCFAYAVFILAHQPILQSNEDVDSLRVLRECLWYLMEPFKKEVFDRELLYKCLMEVKSSNDAMQLNELRAEQEEHKHIDRKERDRNHKELADALAMKEEALHAANEKMWALAEMACMMMTYRFKTQVIGSKQKIVLTKRFFIPLQGSMDATTYAPEELIAEERDGKALRHAGRKGAFESTCASTMMTSTAVNGTRVRKAPASKRKSTTNTTKMRQRRKAVDEVAEETSDEDEKSEPEDEKTDTKAVVATKTRRSNNASRDGGEGTSAATRTSARGRASAAKNAKPKRKQESDNEEEEEEEVESDEEIEEKPPAKIPQRGSRSRNGTAPTKQANGTKEEESPAAAASTAKTSVRTSRNAKISLDSKSPAKESKASSSLPQKNVKMPTSAPKTALNGVAKLAMERADSLENLELSPIVTEGKRRSRSKATSQLVSSTPKRTDVQTNGGGVVKRKAASDAKNDVTEPPAKKTNITSKQGRGKTSLTKATPPSSQRSKAAKVSPVASSPKKTTSLRATRTSSRKK